jgi:hypothetical protein
MQLEPGENQIDVVPGRMRVTGLIRMGPEPVAATLTLGDRTARVTATFESGADGSFEGWLPQLESGKARWFIQAKPHRSANRVTFDGVRPERASSGEAHFVLTIPDGTIHGTVVDEAGAPQAAGVVAVLLAESASKPSLTASEPFSTVSDAETGEFVIRGLSPADYSVMARANRPSAATDGAPQVLLQSDDAIVSVTQPGSRVTSDGVSLVLRPSDAISGRVHTPDGVGVPDATVFAIPAQAPYNAVRPAKTDGQGRYSVNVPPRTSSVMVLIEAVGVGRRATRQATRENEPMDLVLDPASSGILLLESDPTIEYGKVFVYHDGAIDGLRALERWAQAHGEGGEGQIRAPYMSPGLYRVCVPGSMIEAFQMVYVGQPTEQCAEGDLRPGGELRLTVPQPPKGS